MQLQVFASLQPLQQALAAPNTLRIGIQVRLGDTFLENDNKTAPLVRYVARRV